MHRLSAAKGCTQLSRRQHANQRGAACERADFAATALCPIDRGDQHGGLPAPRRLGDPFETSNREAGPPSEPDRVDAAPRQKSFEAIGEIARNRHRPARRTRKPSSGTSLLHYIPTRRQPQTPSRQPRRDIGHQLAAGADDKAQQRSAVVDLAGRDAPPLGSRGIRVGLPRRRRGAVVEGRRAYSRFAGAAVAAAAGVAWAAPSSNQ